MTRYLAAFDDPTGSVHGIPTWPWRQAPEHLLTMRQLAAAGLRPGGQGVQGQILWRSNRYGAPGGVRAAYLYDRVLAVPKRAATPCQLEALAKANAVRRTCPRCRINVGYVPPRYLDGLCVDCFHAQPSEHAA